MMWDGANRRQFVRVAYPCLVRIDAQDNDKTAFLAHTENISAGGLCLIFKKELKRLTHIDIEIDLIDGDDNIRAKGRVVWVVRRKAIETHKPMFYDIGVEFEGLSAQDKKRIETAIETLTQKGYKVLKPVY